MRKARHRIHWQLAAYMGAVICVLMGLFLVIDRAQQWRRLVDARSAYMRQEVRLLALSLGREQSPAARADFLTNYCVMMRYHGKPGHALAVVDPSGMFHTTGKTLTKDDLDRDPVVKELTQAHDGTVGHVYERDDRKALAVARQYTVGSDGGRGIVYYSEPLDDLTALAQKLFTQRAAMALGLLLAVIAVIWLFVKHKVAAPLSALLAHEYAASKGDLHQRRFTDPNNEITDLHIVFNYMLDELEQRELRIQGVQDTSDPRQLASALHDLSDSIAEIQRFLNDRRDQLPRKAQEVLDSLQSETTNLRELVVSLHRALGGPHEGPIPFGASPRDHS